MPTGLSLRGGPAPEDEEEERRPLGSAPAATGRRQVAGPSCCEGDAGLGPGSWITVGAGALGGGCTGVRSMTPER